MFRALVALLALANVAAFSPVSRRVVSSSALRMSETPPAPPTQPAAAAEPAAAEPAEEAPPPPPPVKESSGGPQYSRSLPFLLKPEKTIGVLGGEAEFDPFGFSDLYDIKWMREAELKHGRVAMLASVGYLCTQAGIHLPGNDGLYANPNPIDAVFQVGPSVMLQIVGLIGVLESLNHNGKMGMDNMHEGISFDKVGEFTNPIYGAKMLAKKSPEEAATLKLKELKNGRLAMLAIGGMIHHTILEGSSTVLGPFPNPAIWTMQGVQEGFGAF